MYPLVMLTLRILDNHPRFPRTQFESLCSKSMRYTKRDKVIIGGGGVSSVDAGSLQGTKIHIMSHQGLVFNTKP